MYPEGLGFRAIGRILKISHVTVYNWVKEWGKKVLLPKKEECVEVVELDYVGKKNYCWVWTAVDRLGKRFISFVCGAGSTKTVIKVMQ